MPPVPQAGSYTGNALRLTEQLSKRVLACIEKRLLPILACDLCQGFYNSLRRELFGFQCIYLLEDLVLRWLQDAVKAAQDNQGQHHFSVLRRAVGAAQFVGDGPDFVSKPLMAFSEHSETP